MNILQMTSNMQRNGPAMVVYDLSYGLAELGNEVYIAAAEGELVNEITHPCIHYIHVPTERQSCNKIKRLFLYLINSIKTYKILKRLIKEKHIEIINSHQPISNMYAKFLSKRMNIPFITTSHNVYEQGWLANTYVSGDHVVAVSNKVYRNSIDNFKVNLEKITCVCNGINVDRLKADKLISFNNKFVIGTLAGLRKQKALDKLIIAFSDFHKIEPDSCLVIAGSGEEEEFLKETVKSLNIASNVHFLGFRSDSANILASLDVFALSSEYEGLPIAMLEAMAMAIPVVVTAVGGIPEIISNMQNGILLNYSDTKGMTDAFIKLYNNPELRAAISICGKDTIYRSFDNHKMAREYLKVYTDCLG